MSFSCGNVQIALFRHIDRLKNLLANCKTAKWTITLAAFELSAKQHDCKNHPNVFSIKGLQLDSTIEQVGRLP